MMIKFEKRTEMKDQEFDYVLVCNKVCGASHYNMQMKIIVHDDAGYDTWYAEQLSKNKPADEVEVVKIKENHSDTTNIIALN